MWGKKNKSSLVCGAENENKNLVLKDLFVHNHDKYSLLLSHLIDLLPSGIPLFSVNTIDRMKYGGKNVWVLFSMKQWFS